MNRNLKQRIKEFNKIKFKGNNDTRIIVASLKPNSGYTWKQEADDMIEEYNTWGVTKAVKYNK